MAARRTGKSFELRRARNPLLLCLLALSLQVGGLGLPQFVLAQTPSELSAEETAELEEAERLHQQIIQLYQQGQYQAAIPLAQQALAIRERLLGTDHPAVATSLNNLASLYQDMGNYVAAEPLYQRSLDIWEKALGPDHPSVATSLNNLASLYQDMGNYAAAEPLHQRSLAIREKALGTDHLHVADSLNNLAELYRAMGNYAAAEPLYQRSLAIREKALGTDHSSVANSLNNLALLYNSMGNYAAAEPLYQRSLAIWEKALGADHPSVANSLNNLAGLYNSMGNYAAAEPLYQRSLDVWEKALGENHPSVANSLNNLAELYQAMGNYAAAKPFYQRSLAILEKALGANHPHVATSLNNLATLYSDMGNYAAAEPFLQRSLAIWEETLGEGHPSVATSLNNLALLYSDMGNYAAAEPLYQRSLDIWEKALGENHPSVATSLNNLAVLYHTQRDVSRATTFLNRTLNIQENNLFLIFTTSSESQKRAYMNTLLGATYRAISLHLQASPNNPKTAQLALTTLLRRKGRILDALTDSSRLLRQNLTPENQQLLDQLASTRTQLAALIFNKPKTLSDEAYRQQVATLKREAEQLEAQLSRNSAEFRTENQPVTIEAVQQLIPSDAALVELVRYKPFDAKAQQKERWGEPRYAAYILHSTGAPQWVDLGEAEPINEAAKEFRKRLVDFRKLDPLKKQARTLDTLVMQPIRAKLRGKTHILLSPDSQLNLVPFAALRDENNQYLVENYRITYLTTGRDLIRLSATQNPKQPAVIVANPNYDQPGNPMAGGTPVASRSANLRSTDLSGLQFVKLPGTGKEAEAIAPLLPNSTVLIGSHATENAIKRVTAPKILHIATHGFFLNVELVAPPANGGGDRGQRLVEVRPLPGATAPTPTPPDPKNQENPLLRSGLALAGFNVRSSDAEDGVLTALEAANLNLHGTKLVVLSACQTGLGEVASGEGVYGLRRAFAIAGAESQVISLWQVDDQGTKDLMVDYYQRLLKGEGRSEALRQVQLAMLQNPTYQHPYFWAAFIPSGQWKAMEN